MNTSKPVLWTLFLPLLVLLLVRCQALPPPDTDGDGLLDDEEAALQTSPELADTDGDGLSDGEEVNTYQTDPLLADTDSDDLPDGDEINVYGTDPLLADTDLDLLEDGVEVLVHNTDPLLPDTDFDALLDATEIALGTDPLNPNTDGDIFLDGEEVDLGLDPTFPNAIGFIATVYCAGFASVLGLPYLDDIGVYGPLLIPTGSFSQGVYAGDMVVQISLPPTSLIKVFPAIGPSFVVAWEGLLGFDEGLITDATPDGNSIRVHLSSGTSYRLNFLEVDEVLDWFFGDYVVIEDGGIILDVKLTSVICAGLNQPNIIILDDIIAFNLYLVYTDRGVTNRSLVFDY